MKLSKWQWLLYLANVLLFNGEIVFKTAVSVIVTQRDFYAYLMLCQNGSVPDKKSILLWIENSI